MTTANVMLYSYKIIALCAMILLSTSCSKEEQLQIDVAHVQVLNDPSSALAAQVVVSLNTSKTIKVNCYTDNQQLVYSDISSNKEKPHFTFTTQRKDQLSCGSIHSKRKIRIYNY